MNCRLDNFKTSTFDSISMSVESFQCISEISFAMLISGSSPDLAATRLCEVYLEGSHFMRRKFYWPANFAESDEFPGIVMER